MGNKIKWDTTNFVSPITQVYIYRATADYGVYTTIASIAASSGGSWIGSYSDSSGSDNSVYVLKTYDGTNFSASSAIIGYEYETRLCSVNDVKQYIDTVGRWTDDEVQDAIDFIQDDIYDECNVVKAMYSLVDSNYSEYYVGERQVYRFDNVRYGNVGSQVALYEGAHYTAYENKGIIDLSTTAVGNTGQAWGQGDFIDIEYIPGLYNKYCAARTAQHLMEKSVTVNGEGAEKSLSVINNRVEKLKKQIIDDIGPIISNDNTNYDYKYKIARTRIIQDHDRNKDLLKNKRP